MIKMQTEAQIVTWGTIYEHRHSVRFSCQALQQYKRQSGELELTENQMCFLNMFWHDVIFIFPLYHALGFECLECYRQKIHKSALQFSDLWVSFIWWRHCESQWQLPDQLWKMFLVCTTKSLKRESSKGRCRKLEEGKTYQTYRANKMKQNRFLGGKWLRCTMVIGTHISWTISIIWQSAIVRRLLFEFPFRWSISPNVKWYMKCFIY